MCDLRGGVLYGDFKIWGLTLRMRGWELGWPYELMTENIVCDVRET